MRNIRPRKLAAMLGAAFAAVALSSSMAYAGTIYTQSAIENYEGNAIFRLFSHETGEHLYTPDEYESYYLTTFGAWEYEGVGWFAPEKGTGVYRLYNEELDNHLYTSDKNEAQTLVREHGWVYDNGAKPLFYSGGKKPIYRLYNEKLAGMHLLTMDRNEYASLPKETQGDWAQEGTQLYAQANGFGASDYILGMEDPVSITKERNKRISNTDSLYTIEADVSMEGEGVGYHAKIVAVTPKSGVSFGVQYDTFASKPYGEATAFVMENIASNNEGGQTYRRAGYADPRKTYKLMLTIAKDGTVKGYVDGVLRCEMKNKSLASQISYGQKVYLRVEGSGRGNGDYLKATFENIKLKTNGVYDPNKKWRTNLDTGVSFDMNKGIVSNASQFASKKRITIEGTIKGLKHHDDWDSAYEEVSGIIQFVE